MTLISMRKRHTCFSTTHVLFAVDTCACVVDARAFQRCTVLFEDVHVQLRGHTCLNDTVSIKKGVLEFSFSDSFQRWSICPTHHDTSHAWVRNLKDFLETHPMQRVIHLCVQLCLCSDAIEFES
jgi:hypothetical protein